MQVTTHSIEDFATAFNIKLKSKPFEQFGILLCDAKSSDGQKLLLITSSNILNDASRVILISKYIVRKGNYRDIH